MRLLVSVRNAAEAEAALAGGADIIDAKDPRNGALGAVAPHVLRAIAEAVAGKAPVSAALGDLGRDDVAGGMREAACAGAAFVKVGFAGWGARRVGSPAGRGRPSGRPDGSPLIVVAYADYERADAPSPDELVMAASRMRAAGILLDTCDKSGPGLASLMAERDLRAFAASARSRGLIVALAGRLTADDVDLARSAGADIVGFRGAACDGGRSGVVTAGRVHALRRQVERASAIAS